MGPHGEEAASIIREASEQQEARRDRTTHEEEESEPVNRAPDTGPSIKPGWAEHIEFRQYWIHVTLYRPINERWERTREGWERTGKLVNTASPNEV